MLHAHGDRAVRAGRPGAGRAHRHRHRRTHHRPGIQRPASSAARAACRSSGCPTRSTRPSPCSKDVRHLILVGAKAPVAFFAYPDKPSVLTPDGCQVHQLCTLAEDSIAALEALADAVGAKKGGEVVQPAGRPALPTGAGEWAAGRPRRSSWRRPRRPAPRAPDRVLGERREPVDLAAVGREHAGLVRVGEEGHRRLGADQDQVAHVLQHGERLVDRVRQPLDRHAARRRARCGRSSPRRTCAPRWRWRCGRPAPARARARAGRSACSIAGSPERSALAQRGDRLRRRRARRAAVGGAGATPSASFHAVSAGRISVAIWPGGARAAAIAGRAVGGDGSRAAATCAPTPRRGARRPRCRRSAARRA